MPIRRAILPAVAIWTLLIAGCGHRQSTVDNETTRLSGRVVAESGSLAGARVRIKGKPDFVLTDAHGRFQLPVTWESVRGQTVTAAAEGYFIGGSPVGGADVEIRLSSLPTVDDEAYTWVSPIPDASDEKRCGNCHPAIFAQWHADPHAQTTTGRRFLSLYDGTNWAGEAGHGWNLLEDYPEGAGVCAACHAPTADLDQLAVGDLREISGVAQLGVHCDFCHKIQTVPGDAIGRAHGRFGVSLLRPTTGQAFFGPLDDVDEGQDVFSALQSDSLVCASCHEGVVFGVHVYSTYSEWLESASAQRGEHCQTCHMRPDGEMTNIAPDNGGIERDPQTLASHRFMQEGKLQMLQECLDLNVDVDPTNDHLRLSVEVSTHDVGHRVPTGFIDHHLILVTEATDADGGAVEPLASPVLPAAAGDLAGLPGRLFARRFASHEPADLSTSDADLTWEPRPFWQSGSDVVDTRLEPDSTTSFVLELPTAARQVRVRLLYRHNWHEVAREKSWPDNTLTVHDQSIALPARQQPDDQAD